MNIKSVDPEKIIKVCTAIAYGFNKYEKICEFIFDKKFKNISSGDKNHINRAISTAEQLDMVKINGTDLKTDEIEFNDLDRFDPQIWKNETKSVYFRQKLQKFPPFLKYFDFISKGFSHRSAGNKITSAFSIIPVLDSNSNILRRWGVYAAIFDENGNIKPELSPKTIKVENKFVESLSEGLDNDLKCRLFLNDWLGDDPFNFIDEDIKKDLVFAIKNYKNDPTLSLAKLGNAFEDYLKLVAAFRKIKLETDKGRPLHTIGEIIIKLKTEKILTDHHIASLKGLEVFVSADILNGLNAFRKMTSHGKNVDLHQRWSLSNELTFTIILLLILAIRSTYYYIIKNKLYY